MNRLKRELGTWGAIWLGLGSILGTGAFVSLGISAGVAGSYMVLSLLLAGTLAVCNGLSSAQLAAAYPVSGGTYEYGYRTWGPGVGFTAGWMFMSAKSASAATAALGAAGYLLRLSGGDATWRVPLALAGLLAMTAVVYGGTRRTSTVNALLVTLTLAVLGVLVVSSSTAWTLDRVVGAAPPEPAGILEGAGLLFVAFTGYGRIATLGEEVVDPQRTIPRAILGALSVVTLTYVALAWALLGVLGPEALAEVTRTTAAPLEAMALQTGGPWLSGLVSVAAVAAMCGVGLNLLLGLSRVLLAMARRGDAPAVLATLDASGTTPGPAVLATAGIIATLVCLGDVRATWSFSAFTVLVYYAITNASALRLPASSRRYPRAVSWVGLAGCLSLSVWITPRYVLLGLGLLAVGHVLRAVLRRAR